MSGCAREALHVAQIGFFNDPLRRAPRELLRAWPSLVDVAEAAARSCARVSVLQACVHVDRLVENGIAYHFLPCGAGQRLESLIDRLRELDPDILHVHGLGFHRELAVLAARLPHIPLMVQDHASRPPRLWRRWRWRRGLAAVAGVSFCAAEQAQPFVAAGVLACRTPVYEIPESTSRFTPGDREAARRATGLSGTPAVLSVAHLDANKDPLTVLDGISAAAQTLPGVELWLCFGRAPLKQQVEQRIAGDARLRGRVRLIGSVTHSAVEQLMRGADIFVQGSHREGSGYALIEALACGLPPVVTAIPSFRALTGDASVGRLWPCGDSRSLATALEAVAGSLGARVRAAVRAHFERTLSHQAIGARLAGTYRDILERARRERPRVAGV